MFCQQCGAELRADARFCSKCGGTIAETPAVAPVTEPPANTASAIPIIDKKSPWKVWSLICVIVIVLGGAGVIAWRILTQPKLGDTRINPIDHAEMVWVPGSSFTMGSIDGVGNDHEHPAHQVTLSGYWMYKFEVTVAQYLAFCKATNHAQPQWPGSEGSWVGKSGWDDPALAHHPIVNVSWDDAKAYADWAKVALPSEAQYEYAMRGPHGNNYPWGGTASATDVDNGWDNTKCANSENSFAVGKSTWPVGSFPAGASWCGAQDMAGNVWEWCADWFGDYSTTPVINPTGPASGTQRVLRGGSWNIYNAYNYRGACRNSYYPYGDGDFVGFRCVVLSPGP